MVQDPFSFASTSSYFMTKSWTNLFQNINEITCIHINKKVVKIIIKITVGKNYKKCRKKYNIQGDIRTLLRKSC